MCMYNEEICYVVVVIVRLTFESRLKTFNTFRHVVLKCVFWSFYSQCIISLSDCWCLMPWVQLCLLKWCTVQMLVLLPHWQPLKWPAVVMLMYVDCIVGRQTAVISQKYWKQSVNLFPNTVMLSQILYFTAISRFLYFYDSATIRHCRWHYVCM